MVTNCNWLQSWQWLKVLLITKWTMITKCNWLQSGQCLQGIIDYKVDND